MDIAGITLKNPVMPASGTFGSGQEYSGFVDLNRLGAVVTKGVSCVPWEGNPSPRMHWSTKIGHFNCIFLHTICDYCPDAYVSLYCFGVKYPSEYAGRSSLKNFI